LQFFPEKRGARRPRGKISRWLKQDFTAKWFLKNALQPNFQQCQVAGRTSWLISGFSFFSEKRGAKSYRWESFVAQQWILGGEMIFFRILEKKKKLVKSICIWRVPRFERFKSRQNSKSVWQPTHQRFESHLIRCIDPLFLSKSAIKIGGWLDGSRGNGDYG
jgi:hypothetical protein